jgi:hypothetical protein
LAQRVRTDFHVLKTSYPGDGRAGQKFNGLANQKGHEGTRDRRTLNLEILSDVFLRGPFDFQVALSFSLGLEWPFPPYCAAPISIEFVAAPFASVFGKVFARTQKAASIDN